MHITIRDHFFPFFIFLGRFHVFIQAYIEHHPPISVYRELSVEGVGLLKLLLLRLVRCPSDEGRSATCFVVKGRRQKVPRDSSHRAPYSTNTPRHTCAPLVVSSMAVRLYCGSVPTEIRVCVERSSLMAQGSGR